MTNIFVRLSQRFGAPQTCKATGIVSIPLCHR